MEAAPTTCIISKGGGDQFPVLELTSLARRTLPDGVQRGGVSFRCAHFFHRSWPGGRRTLPDGVQTDWWCSGTCSATGSRVTALTRRAALARWELGLLLLNNYKLGRSQSSQRRLRSSRPRALLYISAPAPCPSPT